MPPTSSENDPRARFTPQIGFLRPRAGEGLAAPCHDFLLIQVHGETERDWARSPRSREWENEFLPGDLP